jgi:nitronate monooxygenase
VFHSGVTGLTTRLTDCLDLEVPVVQAPIGSATCPALAAAVADAGGLGTLAVTWRDPDTAADLLRETRRRSDGAVGANIVLDPAAKSVPTTDHVDACLDAGVDVLSFSFGDGAPYVEQAHYAGALVAQSVGSVEAAETAADAGADIIVAQGWEAGGHLESDVSTLSLVPAVVEAVPDRSVVAAGGIGDGRGIAAALTLGADGAWLGTRFLATEEARVHRAYRERVTAANADETVRSTLFDEGWPDAPHRVLANDTTDAWERAGRPATDRPGADDLVATTPDGDGVTRYEDSLAVPGVDGDVEELPLYAGQSVGQAEEVMPAGDLVETLATEAAAALDDAA